MLKKDRNNTRRSLVSCAISELEAGGIEDARRNAEWMVQEALGCSRLVLYTDPDAPVAPEEAARLDAMLQRRLQREPVQYILGHCGFFGLTLQVSDAVLIPRPETEQLVERALVLIESLSSPRVLDVGTGSGCIALAIKHERPDTLVSACDVSEPALAVARHNAATLGLDVRFLQADILSGGAIEQAGGSFDLIISNPPYIPDSEARQLSAEVYEHEPHLALFSGADPLTYYRAIVEYAHSRLRSGGYLLFEVHMDYAHAVHVLLKENSFADVLTSNDLAGRPRIVQGRWERG